MNYDKDNKKFIFQKNGKRYSYKAQELNGKLNFVDYDNNEDKVNFFQDIIYQKKLKNKISRPDDELVLHDKHFVQLLNELFPKPVAEGGRRSEKRVKSKSQKKKT